MKKYLILFLKCLDGSLLIIRNFTEIIFKFKRVKLILSFKKAKIFFSKNSLSALVFLSKRTKEIPNLKKLKNFKNLSLL